MTFFNQISIYLLNREKERLPAFQADHFFLVFLLVHHLPEKNIILSQELKKKQEKNNKKKTMYQTKIFSNIKNPISDSILL